MVIHRDTGKEKEGEKKFKSPFEARWRAKSGEGMNKSIVDLLRCVFMPAKMATRAFQAWPDYFWRASFA